MHAPIVQIILAHGSNSRRQSIYNIVGSTEMARPKWAKNEVRRAERVGFLRKGCSSPYQISGLGTL